ncbi:hypothetical protein [Candidatus Tisiphia endosymbiont of Sialis lutaria]|uniref:hypothetical protein n=1 Tax=Candidatus Tisiphia endosymbiont of Sialis lutaria TaxID=2029164 RepID=UPI00312C7C7D
MSIKDGLILISYLHNLSDRLYFTLGKFIIEFNYLHAIKPLVEPLASIIKTELCRA